MASIFSFAKRNYYQNLPPTAPKKSNAIRFGLFGASFIAPNAIILPAKSHPEVIIAAIAARDKKKAEAYAKKHGIPIVHDSYEALIVDPTITAVYIPLPNGLHYEWALRALKAGKHVLLEKPSVSNAAEAAWLFQNPLLSKTDAPVLLEAFHYRFHPVWQTFLSLFDAKDVVEVTAQQYLPAGFFPNDDIRFNYELAGGATMDFGSYAINTLRQVFRTEPTSVLFAEARVMAEDSKVDAAMRATYEFSGGAKGSLEIDLQARGGYPVPWLTSNWPSYTKLPKLTVKLAEREVGDDELGEGQKHVVKKTLVLINILGPHIWHRVDAIDKHSIIDAADGKVVKKWIKTKSIKVYEWPEKGNGKVGEVWWTTYRYQLEEFMNRVMKREGSGLWVDAEDSVRQMEMIDKTYLKSGLPLRPSSELPGETTVGV